ncbi:MAG: UDP-N-acetylglucosamine 2-epimerase (non-hydrolyzing) [Candidatus Coatesbacteria bacterium]|nr:UDP-N-acetylglucosamine 2-epimerase (non-hydrolyzing) [Candidatus Coatesbacteria bacterium]
MKGNKIFVVFGTRPEAIKLAPVILAIRAESGEFECELCGTAQHREMLEQVLDVFGISLDFDLRLMQADQSPSDVISRGLPLLMDALALSKPDLVLVQGDTSSTFLGAFAAYLSKIRVAHVEAGLRTSCKYNPFPEEMNRRLTSTSADIHFAPTERARMNLLNEGVPESNVRVTGNTGVDALHFVLDSAAGAKASRFKTDSRLILVTAHRRESFGEPIRRICSALKMIAERHPECDIVFPVHPNPEVRSAVMPMLSQVENIRLLEPLNYVEFVALMRESHLILTDSGGIQEEAPSLGKPVLVLRDETERLEGLDAGVSVLVGSQPDRILSETDKLLNDERYYRSVASRRNPYGDGKAAQRIVGVLKEWMNEI